MKKVCSVCKEEKTNKDFWPKQSQCISCFKHSLISISKTIVQKAKSRLKQKKRKRLIKLGKSSKVVLSSREFNIDYNWVLKQKEIQNNKCFYSGKEMKWELGYILQNGIARLNPYVVSIDRIDPSKGYIKSNCVLVCWKSNCFKSDGSIEEMLEFANAVVSYFPTAFIK